MPFRCKKCNKCNKHNRYSKKNKYNKGAFHLNFTSSHRDVPWNSYFTQLISRTPPWQGATERFCKMELFDLWSRALKNSCRRVHFLVMLQPGSLQHYEKEHLPCHKATVQQINRYTYWNWLYFSTMVLTKHFVVCLRFYFLLFKRFV